jgi:GNAT superfamily N-acetyltransferase
MNDDINRRPPDPFGDDEGILDIQCRPAVPDDLPQIAFLGASLLDRVFNPVVGHQGQRAIDLALSALKARIRFDCTWVMHEGETVIGILDIETLETRRLNGFPLARALANSLGITEKVENAGLLPLLLYEPAPDEAYQALVALLPGSRGEGRGPLLLMHGNFWARAQGKDWMTTWLPATDTFIPVYKKRGYFVEMEVDTNTEEVDKWLLLKRPISPKAYKAMRIAEKNGG